MATMITGEHQESEPLRILYQDDHLVAMHKPSGMLVHPTKVDRHEQRIALPLLRDRIGQHLYPVHRLDKPTSGVLVFALDPDTARELASAFQAHQVRKDYLAVVRGWPPLGGIIDQPLAPRDPDSRKRKRRKAPQSAMTLYHRLACTSIPISVDGRYTHTRYSLVRLRPVTGRRHQLRRHLKSRNHPLIGDVNYGKGIHNRFFREQYGLGRLMLCAVSLSFEHPVTGEPLRIRTTPDEDFTSVAEAVGLHLGDWAGAGASAPEQ
ncbi:MAG: pseudouridine synthase [Pseudomonadota bacterium]